MTKILAIVKEPQKVLRGKAREIPLSEIPSSKIQKLIADMKETLKNTSDGVGLAASQVGEPLRLFIASEEAEFIDEQRKKKPTGEIERPVKDWKYYIFINPLVKKSSRKKLNDSEGCLSVPGKFGILPRSEKIIVEAYDENGRKFTRGASNFFARVMQHELDHLEGTLFIDKAEDIKRV